MPDELTIDFPGPAAAPEGRRSFLVEWSVTIQAAAQELGMAPTSSVDVVFLGFLRLMARFDVFSFGPITIHVPTLEPVIARACAATEEAEARRTFVRVSEQLLIEQQRSGASQINELHALLALMRVNEGVPARVFGELGVTPEDVERFAITGRIDAADGGLERLYSPEEAAEYLGVHVQTVRAWIRSGRLRASRLAGQRALRITASDLTTVLEPVAPEDPDPPSTPQ